MKIVAFAGGVGGAKLAEGLAQTLSPNELTIVVNTGDDFEHWGLKICPDLDTVCYTLAGLANPETGWGRIAETWNVFDNMQLLNGEQWFHIGDQDLATHIERTQRLKAGETLSQITHAFCRAWNIKPTILPMTDDLVATIVDTVEYGELAFQEYFVHKRCAPTVKGFRFAGVASAKPAPGVMDAINHADAIVFCPSNPWVSIDPILATLTSTPLISKEKVAESRARVVAISPIIGGQTVKGPAAKMFAEVGITPSALAVAQHYGPLVSGMVIDSVDAALKEDIEALGQQVLSVDILMKISADRQRLARDVLNFIERLA